jgi:galactonate dehydratase
MSPGHEIAAIETIRLAEQPNVLWVQITDADGAVGTGETYYLPGAVDAVIHEMAAPHLLGADARAIERIWQLLFSCANFHGFAGAEMRAFSALDIALWDLAGKRTQSPIATLLGGRNRDTIRVYATCVDAGAHADQTGWLERPAQLAQELLDAGFTAMKIWPWDRFAPQVQSIVATGPAGWSAMGPAGSDLTPGDLRAGLACIEAIREGVGDSIEIMIEGHARWDVNAALTILHALEPFTPTWAEDMIQPTSARDLQRLTRESRVPQAVSERLIGKWAYRDVLELQAAHLVMVDIVWTGGVTEARKIATLAETYHLPLIPHDCVGPVALASSLQLCAHAPTAKVQEVVRGFLDGWYTDVIEEPFEIDQGVITIPERPGHGATLAPDLRSRPGAVVRRSPP